MSQPTERLEPLTWHELSHTWLSSPDDKGREWTIRRLAPDYQKWVGEHTTSINARTNEQTRMRTAPCDSPEKARLEVEAFRESLRLDAIRHALLATDL